MSWETVEQREHTTEDRPLAPGEYFGKYRIRRLLGQGGMGRVYAADDEFLERSVALKLMRVRYARGRYAAGPRKEARILCELDHPNIVKVHDAGLSDAGITFLVMELVDGDPLRAVMEAQGIFDPLPAAVVAAQVADALRVAHRAGIIHRDLKPENVLVKPSGLAKVVDFGIATHGQGSTDPYQGLGTIAYMAPEQLRDAIAIAASDVYALGLIFYELLTGQHPFSSEPGLLPPPTQLFANHLVAIPKPPHELAPQVPPDLSALVGRMLAKEPAERPGAAEVQRMLSAWVKRNREAHGPDEHAEPEPVAPIAMRPRSSLPPAAAAMTPQGPPTSASAWQRTAPLPRGFQPPSPAPPRAPVLPTTAPLPPAAVAGATAEIPRATAQAQRGAPEAAPMAKAAAPPPSGDVWSRASPLMRGTVIAIAIVVGTLIGVGINVFVLRRPVVLPAPPVDAVPSATAAPSEPSVEASPVTPAQQPVAASSSTAPAPEAAASSEPPTRPHAGEASPPSSLPKPASTARPAPPPRPAPSRAGAGVPPRTTSTPAPPTPAPAPLPSRPAPPRPF